MSRVGVIMISFTWFDYFSFFIIFILFIIIFFVILFSISAKILSFIFIKFINNLDKNGIRLKFVEYIDYTDNDE